MKNYFFFCMLAVSFAFFAGCGGKPIPIKVYPCKVGLTLKPGEGCRYTYKDKNYDLDFLFYVVGMAAGFRDVNIKTPTTQVTSGGGLAEHGGAVRNSYGNDVQLEISGNMAYICIDRELSINTTQGGFSGKRYSMGKCFTAERNSDGSWTVKSLPLSP